MTKLFLASYVFTTGDKEHKDARLVLVRSQDLKDEPEGTQFPWLNTSYRKFNKWFPKDYPESELISVVIQPPIEDDAEDETPNIMLSKAKCIEFAKIVMKGYTGNSMSDEHWETYFSDFMKDQ